MWNKAETDTVGLKAFYDKIKENYKYNVRVTADVYTMKDEATYNKFMKMVTKTGSPKLAMDKLNEKESVVTKDSVIYAKEDNKTFDNLFRWDEWKNITDTIKENHNIVISQNYKLKNSHIIASVKDLKFVDVHQFLSPTPKPLVEIKGTVVSLYQNYLEEEWIKELRSNNQVWVDEKAIISLIKK